MLRAQQLGQERVDGVHLPEIAGSVSRDLPALEAAAGPQSLLDFTASKGRAHFQAQVASAAWLPAPLRK